MKILRGLCLEPRNGLKLDFRQWFGQANKSCSFVPSVVQLEQATGINPRPRGVIHKLHHKPNAHCSEVTQFDLDYDILISDDMPLEEGYPIAALEQRMQK